ncbi:MAG: heavy-metal-associated domain-containing protein [Bacteroidales bacterium]|nr:heavy-metal-associated domain-containing protein [Bacteroidales bacterium]
MAFAATCTVSAADAQGKKKKELKEVNFNVYLHCEDCVEKVNENIAFEKGVKGLEVSLENQTVLIKYDVAKTSEDKLKAAIEKLGYPVHGALAPGQKPILLEDVEAAQEHNHDHNHAH